MFDNRTKGVCFHPSKNVLANSRKPLTTEKGGISKLTFNYPQNGAGAIRLSNLNRVGKDRKSLIKQCIK